jgi:ubiquinone/menaquinone biosynthesis C-methylase UbiE
MPSEEEVNLQRKYSADTAAKYDAMQISEQDEHQFALAILSAMIEYHGIRSVLDVGSGTGRALRYLKSRHPGVRFVGIEPVEALRKVGHAAGLSSDELRDGDVNALQADDGEFDLVCEFAVLHHVPQPSQAVGEMLRVARKAIFISDANNFGQGGRLARFIKQAINALGLWRAVDYVRTGGKGYHVSAGDGLFYSYSVFNNYHQIREACACVHSFNTVDAAPDLRCAAPHVALLGLKRQP